MFDIERIALEFILSKAPVNLRDSKNFSRLGLDYVDMLYER